MQSKVSKYDAALIENAILYLTNHTDNKSLKASNIYATYYNSVMNNLALMKSRGVSSGEIIRQSFMDMIGDDCIAEECLFLAEKHTSKSLSEFDTTIREHLIEIDNKVADANKPRYRILDKDMWKRIGYGLALAFLFSLIIVSSFQEL